MKILHNYLKDIVSRDTFGSDVKLIAKIKPVLDASPDGLHSASCDGAKGWTLERNDAIFYSKGNSDRIVQILFVRISKLLRFTLKVHEL